MSRVLERRLIPPFQFHGLQREGQRPLLLTPLPGLTRADIDTGTRSIWRYRAALPLAGGEKPISLGEGGTPLAIEQDGEALGIIYLKDTVKPGMRERFDELRRMGIKTIMVTGDNAGVATSVAAQIGISEVKAGGFVTSYCRGCQR